MYEFKKLSDFINYPEEVKLSKQFKPEKEKTIKRQPGDFHEQFVQRVVDPPMKDLKIRVAFWRRIARSKVHYDTRLSNGKQINRVFQVDHYC